MELTHLWSAVILCILFWQTYDFSLCFSVTGAGKISKHEGTLLYINPHVCTDVWIFSSHLSFHPALENPRPWDIIISCGHSHPLQPGLNEMRWEASPIIFWLLSSAPLLSDGCKPSQHISHSTFHPATLLLSLSLPGWERRQGQGSVEPVTVTRMG